MTRKQRVRAEVAYIKRTEALGAGRTTELDNLRAVYNLSPEMLKRWCVGVGGCDYWT